MILLQLQNHVKWSEDKHGAVMIHSRYGKSGTSYIRSASGKEIWYQLTETCCDRGHFTLDDLVEGLHRKFGNSVTMAVLKQDLTEFLDQLAEQRIIRAFDND